MYAPDGNLKNAQIVELVKTSNIERNSKKSQKYIARTESALLASCQHFMTSQLPLTNKLVIYLFH